MKPVQLLNAAIAELSEASHFYDAQRGGLGKEYLDTVYGAFATIAKDPEVWPLWRDVARSYRVSRFPFRVFYRESKGIILIVAVAHLSRRPGYWMERLDQE